MVRLYFMTHKPKFRTKLTWFTENLKFKNFCVENWIRTTKEPDSVIKCLLISELWKWAFLTTWYWDYAARNNAAKLELCCKKILKKVIYKFMLQGWNYAAIWNYAAVYSKIKAAALFQTRCMGIRRAFF